MSETALIWIAIIFSIVLLVFLLIVFLSNRKGDANIAGEISLLDKLFLRISGSREGQDSSPHDVKNAFDGQNVKILEMDAENKISVDEIIGVESESGDMSDGSVEIGKIKAKDVEIKSIVGAKRKK